MRIPISALLAVAVAGCGATHATAPAGRRATTSAEPPERVAARPSRHGRPETVAGPAIAMRFSPADGRLRVQGSVAFQLAGGSASFVDAIHRWTIGEGRRIDEQLLSARYRSATSGDAPMPYVSAPDGQIARWSVDDRAHVVGEPEIVSTGDPARDLATLMLPELVHTRIALPLPPDRVAPGDAWTSSHAIAIPTHFGRWSATYRVEHQLLRVERGEAHVWLEGEIALPRRDAGGVSLEGRGEVWGLARFRVDDGTPTALDLREAVEVWQLEPDGSHAPRTMGWERRIALEIARESG